MSKLKFEIVHFLVILVLLLLNIWGCGGQPLHSKSILKASSQMVRLCDYATVFFSYLHIDFLTFLALLKNTFWDGTPCNIKYLEHFFLDLNLAFQRMYFALPESSSAHRVLGFPPFGGCSIIKAFRIQYFNHVLIAVCMLRVYFATGPRGSRICRHRRGRTMRIFQRCSSTWIVITSRIRHV